MFGDTIEDILLYKKFYTGEHLTAPEKVIGTNLFTWQAFDTALRETLPTLNVGNTWARQYQLGLAWLYVLGDKFRVTLYQPPTNRHATIPLDATARATQPLPQAFATTFTLGLGQLNG